MKNFLLVMKKILVFVKKQPVYVLMTWVCCLISIILNIIATFTNNNTIRLIAWLFIIIQFSFILIQFKVYKFDRDIMSEENTLNIYNIGDMNKYKSEYNNKLNLLQRIKVKFSNKKIK